MLARWAGVTLLLAAAGMSGCGWFTPGLGRGVEGADAPGPRPREEAFASLALVTLGDQVLGTAPVIAVRGNRVAVLAMTGVGKKQLPEVSATFTSEKGVTETVTGAEVVMEYEGMQLGLSFPAPKFAVHATPVATAGHQAEAGSLRVVELRKGAGPVVLTATSKTPVSADAQELRLTVPAPGANRGIRLVFEETKKGWQLLALGGMDEELRAQGALPAVQAASGKPRRAVLRLEQAGEGCAVAAEVEVDDAAGTFVEAGLVVGEPGVAWAIPELVHARGPWESPLRKGEPVRDEQPVVPVGKKLAARARLDAAGKAQLRAEVKRCDELRFAQVVLLGVRERWLSWPYRLPGEADGKGAPVVLAAGRDAWRVDDLPAALPLVWTGQALPLPPEGEPEPGCRLPPDRLDPAGAYVVGVRNDGWCADGQLVFPAGEEEKARCIAREQLQAIAEDGLAVYAIDGESRGFPFLWRREVPDRNAKDAAGACRLASPRLNDDVLLTMGTVCGGNQAFGMGPFFGPGGELVFACRDRFVRRDGTALDLHGGALLRLGEGGHVLVRLPWGMLGVLGPDGKGREVGGLPLGVRFDRPTPSAAVSDGFLVALEVRDPGPGRGLDPAHDGDSARTASPAQLVHVSFAGVATARGEYGAVEEKAGLARHLDPSGALYTLTEERGKAAQGPITRHEVGKEPQVVFDGSARAAEDRLELQPLLLGWRAAGPSVPAGVGFFSGALPGPLWAMAPLLKDPLATYAPAEAAALPCKPTLQALDPKRAWLWVGSWIFDPADPSRFTWAERTDLRLGGDGRLLRLREGEVRPLELSAATLRPQPDGLGCFTFSGAEATAAVPGGKCDDPAARPFEVMRGWPDWRPVPDGGALLACTRPGTKATAAGGRELPEGYRLHHAGLEGRLLLSAPPRPGYLGRTVETPLPSWVVLLANGKQVPLTGIPPAVRAVRAVTAGFLLAVEPAPRTASRPQVAGAPPAPSPAPAPMELLLATDDGRVRKLGSYPPLPADEEVGGVALTPDQLVHVLLTDRAGRVRLLRVTVDGDDPADEWVSPGPMGRFAAALLTGP
jgi:hypothetical protein